MTTTKHNVTCLGLTMQRAIMTFLFALVATTAPATRLTLLHVNDLHAHYQSFMLRGQKRGGFAPLAAMVNAIRKGGTPTLLLNAGDTFQGSLFFHQFAGRLGMRLLRLLGQDAMVLGNHEFDRGVRTLIHALRLLKTPVLATNLRLPERHPLRARVKPWVVLTRGGMRVGLFGLLTPDRAVYNQRLRLSIGDPHAAARRAVAALSKQGVHLIIAVTHLGVQADRKLARAVRGIDVIVGGHSHTELPHGTWLRSPAGEPVLILQAGQWGAQLGRADLWINARGVLDPVRTRVQLIPIVASAGNPRSPTATQIVRLIATAERKLKRWTRQIVGRSTARLLPSRTRETAVGNLVTDAVRWRLRKHRVQCALVNSGAIRGSIPRGPITLGRLLSVLPFENRLLVIELSGAELRRVLEHSVAIIDRRRRRPPRGQLLQLSGCRLHFDPRRPRGSRVIALSVAGTPIRPADHYRIAIPDFIHLGGDGYDFRRAKVVHRSRLLMWQALRDYLRVRRLVSPKCEGRLLQVP